MADFFPDQNTAICEFSIWKAAAFVGNNLKIKCKDYFKNSRWQGAIFHRAKVMWNRLPQDIVSCEEVEHFRLKLKRFDLNTINTSKIH